MKKLNRRNLFRSALGTAAAAMGHAALTSSAQAQYAKTKPINNMRFTDYQPEKLLVVPETRILKAKYPVIDMHTHVTHTFNRMPTPGEPLQGATPKARLDQIVKWMDETNIKRMVNLTGGFGPDLDRTMKELVNAYPGRFVTCTVPTYKNFNNANYPQWQAEELGRAKKQGAVGLKILKTLGMYLREGGFKYTEREEGQQGPLVKIDDPRLFPMWKAAGDLKMPVFIHISDVDSFWEPFDKYNERWEELLQHPEVHYHGTDVPPKKELHAARNRVIAAHPNTHFILLHVGTHPENLDDVTDVLNTYPNTTIEFSASLGELGRQPRRARKFIEEFQDRVMFGTDASPNGLNHPQQDLEPEMYRCYFRWLETEDEHFDYSSAKFPPQGFWRIYGIGLPDDILKKIYHNNAARIMGWETI